MTDTGNEFSSTKSKVTCFSSIYKIVTRLFIHAQEGYGVALKHVHCRLSLVTSSSVLVTVNSRTHSCASTIHNNLYALKCY